MTGQGSVQAQTSRDEGFQGLHDAERRMRQRLEFERYRGTSKRSLVEEYCEGDVSLFFNLDLSSEIDIHYSGTVKAGHQFDLVSNAMLVFNANASTSSVAHDRQDEFVLVGDICLVKTPKVNIPSTVRLYIGCEFFEEGRVDDLVYLSLRKCCIKRLSVFAKRKLGVLSGQSEAFDDGNPGVIQSRSQIVEGIASDECDVSKSLVDVRTFILDRVSASIRILLDARNVGFMKREDSSIKLSDMLIGPINLQPRIAKQ